MLTVVLALLAAAGDSGSDYTAGLAAREADVVQVTFVAELVYCILLLAAVPFASSQSPSWSALVWGAGAGISGVVAAMALYRGSAMPRSASSVRLARSDRPPSRWWPAARGATGRGLARRNRLSPARDRGGIGKQHPG